MRVMNNTYKMKHAWTVVHRPEIQREAQHYYRPANHQTQIIEALGLK